MVCEEHAQPFALAGDDQRAATPYGDPMPATVHAFEDLPPQLAYAAWRLRQDVFVLEQACLYADLDGRDTEPGTRHVLLTDPEDAGELLGYCRVLDDPGAWRIGRVVLAARARGRGLADAVMTAALADCAARDAGRDIVLSAQSPLAGWYATFGFVVDGAEFLEDDIRHTPMRLRRP